MKSDRNEELRQDDIVIAPDGAACFVVDSYKVFGRTVYALIHPRDRTYGPLGRAKLRLVGHRQRGQTIYDIQNLAEER